MWLAVLASVGLYACLGLARWLAATVDVPASGLAKLAAIAGLALVVAGLASRRIASHVDPGTCR